MAEIEKSFVRISIRISIITIITIMLIINIKSFFNLANGQGQLSPCDNGRISASSNKSLPVILVHGYKEDSSVWSKWELLLNRDGIPFCRVTFQPDDECDSAAKHAKELVNIVQAVKAMTGQNRVNIVGHSKGGLDARVYLANSGTHDVANLIMIGTPNAGSPLANIAALVAHSDWCTPALYNFTTFADDLSVKANNNTRYFTIAGDWVPPLSSGSLPLNCTTEIHNPTTEIVGFSILSGEAGPNDGVVSVSSVESLPYSTSLGHTSDCNTNLLSQPEYNLVKHILISGR